jgi:hypothetical protein
MKTKITPAKPAAALAAPTKPAKPALAAPTKPAKPALAAPTKPAVPAAPTKPAVPAAPTVDTAAELAAAKKALDAAKAEIVKLTSAVAASKRKGQRTIGEILLEAPACNDWRDEQSGWILSTPNFCFDLSQQTVIGEEAKIKLHAPRVMIRALLAIPRDSERHGAMARGQGLLAVHVVASEDGSAYAGEPLYLTQGQLGELFENGADYTENVTPTA